ncbi:transcriptional regulatory [Fusarium beomiforme]|uniref:Cofilin n=1 Tax=Fusarium beomiforme TaxID=44412 RepID=A0A9P5DR93_9HYPO|nr:transcriptional regulatory [Fusarium beomiforme]
MSAFPLLREPGETLGSCQERRLFWLDELGSHRSHERFAVTELILAATPDNRITQLEEYVAALEARLAKVELRLDKPKQPSTSTTPASASAPTDRELISSVSPAGSSQHSVYDVAPSPGGDLYEGTSSFLQQSVQASEEIQRSAAAETSEAAQTINESFNELNSILNGQSDKRQPSAASTHPIPDITPLPSTVVLAIIRKIKAHPTRFFPGQALTDVRLIEHICQKVYFPTEPVTLGHITCVNGLMRLILREFIITKDDIAQEHNLEELKAQAERNFNRGLQTFELMTVPSFENVIAITAAVLKIQNEGAPVLARSLVNVGLSHCQMLGYHREVTYQKDKSGFSENKRRLFWTLVQDFEVDAHYPTILEDPAEKPWTMLFHLAIRLAKIQGLVFDKLYSVSGLQSPAADRRQWIDSLVADMHQWRYDLDHIDGSTVRFAHLLDLSMTHWDIMYYTTLTILLRAPAMPGVGTDMTSQCFQAARLSLKSYLRAFSGYGGEKMLSKADYIDWALHNASFTPFVVIFLHSIAASSLEDVELLEQVVTTFRSARDINVGAEKLYQICSTFARLARRMVESRNTSVGMYDHSNDSLQMAGVSENVPLSWTDVGQPSEQQAGTDGFADFLNDDMTNILADWINGQPPTSDIVSLDQDCITAANYLRFAKGPNKIKFVIFKITDDEQSVVVEETSPDTEYETFRQKLLSAVDKHGKSAPRYALYDVDYDLGEDGKRTKAIFVSWVPQNSPIKLRMLYASTMEYLKRAVNMSVFIHADGQEDIEWEELVKAASRGKAK